MDPVVTARMRRMLVRNAAYRRDVARSPRAGVLYIAEVKMEARLILDASAEMQSTMKRPVAEVAPEWIGESTARRILHDWIGERLVVTEVDPEDGRAVLLHPTPAMLARASSRWSRIDDDLPEAKPLPTPRRVG